MGQTLTHGIYLPDEGERNCYDGLAANWQLLDGAVGTVAEHTTALAGKAPAVHTHTKADVTDLLNSNFIPSANNSYDLGSSSYQWNNLYAKNYYYNGVAWGLDKANVWTANQTVSINLPTITLQDTIGVRNTAPTNTRNLTFSFLDKNGDSYGFINRQHKTSGTHLHQVGISNGTYDYRLQFYLFEGGLSSFMPSNDGIVELGTSSYRWKTLNGVNPGALSLPNVKAVTGSSNTQLQDISGDLVQDQYFNCYFTPRMDGWAYIALNCSNATIRSGHSSFSVMVKTARSFANALYTQAFTKNENAWTQLGILFPVTANKEITLEYTFTGFSVTKAYVIPAQGNV